MLKIMEMHFDFKLSSILSGIGALQSKVEQISVETGAPLDEEDAGERVMNRKRHSVAMTECKPCSCSKDADQEAFEDEETRDGGLRRIPALTEQEILAAVAQMNFEQAARLRDAIAVLKPSSYSGQRCPDNGNPSEADVNAVSSPIEEKRRAAVLERALARASGRAPGPAVKRRDTDRTKSLNSTALDGRGGISLKKKMPSRTFETSPSREGIHSSALIHTSLQHSVALLLLGCGARMCSQRSQSVRQ